MPPDSLENLCLRLFQKTTWVFSPPKAKTLATPLNVQRSNGIFIPFSKVLRYIFPWKVTFCVLHTTNGFSIHGEIDGYSRSIPWLEICRSNNKPEILASFYLNCVKEISNCPLLITVVQKMLSCQVSSVIFVKVVMIFLLVKRGTSV